MPDDPQGWLRGDSGAARYLDMDRKTWVKMRRKHKVRASIFGKTRRFSCADLDRLMRSLQQPVGANDILRPALSRRNRARAKGPTQQLSSVSTTSETTST